MNILFEELGALSQYQEGFAPDLSNQLNTPFHVALRANNRAFLDCVITDQGVVDERFYEYLQYKNQLSEMPLDIALSNEAIELDYFKKLYDAIFHRYPHHLLQTIYKQSEERDFLYHGKQKLAFLKKSLNIQPDARFVMGGVNIQGVGSQRSALMPIRKRTNQDRLALREGLFPREEKNVLPGGAKKTTKFVLKEKR